MAGCIESSGRSVRLKGDTIKEDMLIDSATHQDLYLCAIAEHRWTSEGERSAPDNWHCVHTSANVSTGDGYKGGVGCYLSPKASRAWRDSGSAVEYIDHRIISLRLPVGRRMSSVVVYYAPHSGRPADERQRFWQDLEQCVLKVPKHDVLILLGDSNASVGEVQAAGVTGSHGAGKCNDAGSELLDWCSHLELRIMNGFFCKAIGVPQTWRPPANPPVPWENGLTIDHCITRSRDAAALTDVDVREPAEYNSDHRMLVVAVTPLRGQGAWQRKMQRRQCVERFKVSALRNSNTRGQFTDAIQGMLDTTPMNDDVHMEWEQIVNVLQTVGDDVLGHCKPRRSTWQEEFAHGLHEMAQERRGLASACAADSTEFKTRLREVRAAHQRETRSFVRG
eukprot:gene12340-biopygen7307